jgi:multiple sugar transport system substrate-binding protein
MSQADDRSPPASPGEATATATATKSPTPTPRPTETPTKTSRPTATPRPTPQPTATPAEPTPIRWFIGLGAGSDEVQISAEEEWVADFNARQNEIELTADIVDNAVAADTLKSQIAADVIPDIVGPVGVLASNELYGLWLDLEDHLRDYDLSDFSRGAIDTWQVPGQGLIGLPIVVYPSALYINRDLFEKAGLDYPPQDYASGGRWTIDALEELAMVLTIDAYGNDATSRSFDPDNIVQFGFIHQWSDLRGLCTFFGAGSFVADDGKTAQCPDHWREALRWYYRGMWEDYFAPNGFYQNDVFGGNPFDSGSVAMANSQLWYTCCVGNVPNWDYAIVPAYDGTHTAKLHTDIVGVLKNSDHPVTAVETAYAIATSPELIETWGAAPALTSLQDGFFAKLDERFPQGVNWDTLLAGLEHIDIPNHEGWLPNFSQAYDRIQVFQSLLDGTDGLDVDAAIDELIADLQAIFDAAD